MLGLDVRNAAENSPMQMINPRQLEGEILARLLALPEVQLAGFFPRAGLTGAGVTLMRGRSFYGSWRVSHGALVWNFAHSGGESYFANSLDDAIRHTLLLILRALETDRAARVA